MIRPDKTANALYAHQGVLIHARTMAYAEMPQRELAALLDYAEMLPRLIASDRDETAAFREYLDEIAKRYSCEFVVQRFDEQIPRQW